jgi:hypothetical protein
MGGEGSWILSGLERRLAWWGQIFTSGVGR